MNLHRNVSLSFPDLAGCNVSWFSFCCGVPKGRLGQIYIYRSSNIPSPQSLYCSNEESLRQPGIDFFRLNNVLVLHSVLLWCSKTKVMGSDVFNSVMKYLLHQVVIGIVIKTKMIHKSDICTFKSKS